MDNPSLSNETRLGDTLTVGLAEYDTGWHDPARSLSDVREIALQAKAAGAGLLVLPEMCTTGFTMDAENYAEPLDGPSSHSLSALAKELDLGIIAGLATRRDGKFFNSAMLFGPDGTLAATYDKQRLFGFAHETEIYSAGAVPCIVEIGGVSLALFVCFDLRFPELFREVGPKVDAFVIIANWPSARQKHWEILPHARAIENQCFVVAVNRSGEADGLEYTGGSVFLDPWGERRDVVAPGSSLRIGEISKRALAEVRKAFPLPLPGARDP
ncbi:MAG: nitrilase-related carbon-nitrogen hydrolase [Gemmatimonadaceae bacterium]